jgi:hypothetical protein
MTQRVFGARIEQACGGGANEIYLERLTLFSEGRGVARTLLAARRTASQGAIMHI